MQHILDCPDFLEKGVCDRGKSCPLRHRKRVLRTRNKITDDAKVEVLHCHRCVLALLVLALWQPYWHWLASPIHIPYNVNVFIV